MRCETWGVFCSHFRIPIYSQLRISVTRWWWFPEEKYEALSKVAKKSHHHLSRIFWTDYIFQQKPWRKRVIFEKSRLWRISKNHTPLDSPIFWGKNAEGIIQIGLSYQKLWAFPPTHFELARACACMHDACSLHAESIATEIAVSSWLEIWFVLSIYTILVQPLRIFHFDQ